jgi:tRNA pseudouridine55 synthase
MQPGIYLVHKPVGVTSFSLVRALMQEVEAAGLSRKRLPVAHGGTLDPFAHGLLLLLAGPATQLMELIHPVPKTYVARVVWGTETDNGDLLGRVVQQASPEAVREALDALTPQRLDAALRPFLGWHEQVPPTTSAKKIDGEPAYRKVHRGEAVTLPPSRVYLHAARWRSHALPHSSELELTCRGGFYVRALARELGRSLGCGAHLATLARTAIGPWEDPGPGAPRVHVQGRGVLPWCPWRPLSDAEVGRLKRGEPIASGTLQPPDWPLPPGYPDVEPPVRGFHRERLLNLLWHQPGDALASRIHLRGGL